MPSPDITAIVPNWNGAAMLDGVLGDLGAQTAPPARVLVVDNGSTDGSEAVARKHCAAWLPLGSNRGFAHAVNRGLAESATPLVAILNNDVRLEPRWLATLHTALTAAPDAAFATGKIFSLRKEGVLDGAFDAVCRGACAWRCSSGRPDSEVWNEPRTVTMAPFTAALLRRELFDAVGPLDETFESYLEDVDFGIRSTLAGRHGLYVPEATSRHWGSATLGMWRAETVRRIARNQVYLVAKHFPRRWALRYGWPVVVAQLLYGCLALRHGALGGFVQGKWEGLAGYRRQRRAAAPPERFAEMVKLSERMIFDLQQRTGFDWYWRLYFALT
jgi:GT2 family glycosyltransferase